MNVVAEIELHPATIDIKASTYRQRQKVKSDFIRSPSATPNILTLP
jgi:hypothetical protein